MTAFVALLFGFPLLIGLWIRFKVFRKPRSEAFRPVLSIGSVSQSFVPQPNDRDQICRACHTGITHPEAARDEVQVKEIATPSVYYFAAWTDSGCLLGCRHHHATVISAVACISEVGGYVIAVEKERLRALNDAEEKLFLYVTYGIHRISRRFPVFEPKRVLKPSLN